MNSQSYKVPKECLAPSPLELSQELKALSELMVEIGAKMDYYGGFSETGAPRGREMINAAMIVEGWADGIASESA